MQGGWQLLSQLCTATQYFPTLSSIGGNAEEEWEETALYFEIRIGSGGLTSWLARVKAANQNFAAEEMSKMTENLVHARGKSNVEKIAFSIYSAKKIKSQCILALAKGWTKFSGNKFMGKHDRLLIKAMCTLAEFCTRFLNLVENWARLDIWTMSLVCLISEALENVALWKSSREE